MIRRDWLDPVTGAHQWLLLGQVEHAQLSAQLAAGWGAPPFASALPADEVQWAIGHHDDGWRFWDEAPDVDPESGRPRSFTEMDPADSLAIWTTSIEGAAQRGPLEGYAVAGHFCSLAERFLLPMAPPAAAAEIQTFLAEFTPLMQSWREAWTALAPGNLATQTDDAVRWVRFFDQLSLWFCCAEVTEPEELESPEGHRLRIVPRGSGQIEVSPWPWKVDRLPVAVAGRAVPVAHYASRQALAAAPSQSVRLEWQLTPGAAPG